MLLKHDESQEDKDWWGRGLEGGGIEGEGAGGGLRGRGEVIKSAYQTVSCQGNPG